MPEILNSQVGITLIPNNFRSAKNYVQLNNHSIKLENAIHYEGEVYLKVFLGSVPNSDKLIAKSEVFVLSSSSEIYQLRSIFNSDQFEVEKETKNICFQILQANNDLHLGLARLNVFKDLTNDKKKLDSKLFSVHGNLKYQLEYGSFQNEDPSFINSIQLDGKANLFGVPLNLASFQTSFHDQFSSYNPSNSIFSFDRETWQQRTRERLEPILSKELKEQVGSLGAFNALETKLSYLNRLTKKESFIADLKEVSSLDSLLTLENLKGSDAIEKEIELLSSKLKNVNSSLGSLDSLTKQDSLIQESKQIKERLETLNYFQDLKSKSKAFQRILVLKDSCEIQIARSKKKMVKLKALQEEVVENPKKLNTLLKKEGIVTDLDYVLNYVSDFKVGLNNPRYSSLAFRRTINNGISFGLDFGSSSVSSFAGKLQNLPKYIRDTSAISDVWAYGFKYKLKLSKHFESEAFVSTIANFNYQNLDKTKSLIGYNLEYSPAKNSKLKFESIWSTNEFSVIDEFEESQGYLGSLVRNTAAKVEWKSEAKNLKLKWKSYVEYFGPDFYDIESYFNYNDFVNSSLSVNAKLTSDFSGSFFLSSKYNNLWEETNIFENSQSIGAALFFSKKNWPFIQYSSNAFWNNGNDYDLFSSVHNVLISTNNSLFKNDLSTAVNLNYINNHTNIDTIFSNIFSTLISLDYSLTDKSDISFSYDFSSYKLESGTEIDYNLILRFPYTSKYWGIDFGAKYIQSNQDSQYGFIAIGYITVHKKISLNLELDSHRQVQYFEQDFNRTKLYRPFYRLTINYKL